MPTDAKVPDLFAGDCIHARTYTIQYGADGASVVVPFASHQCHDCIRLALAAAKDEGRREALEEAAETCLIEGAIDCAAAIRALSRGGGEGS